MVTRCRQGGGQSPLICGLHLHVGVGVHLVMIVGEVMLRVVVVPIVKQVFKIEIK